MHIQYKVDRSPSKFIFHWIFWWCQLLLSWKRKLEQLSETDNWTTVSLWATSIMKMIWGLCLLFLAGGIRVYAGPLRKTKAAPQEEVNVLMFGVIQLSESLNAVYETTEAKIAKISQTLKSHEGTLQRLGRQTEQAAEVEKQIKEVIQLLQVRKYKDM